MSEVSIIGAGVAGLCVARALLDRGAQIQLVDRHADIGAHACSWWAGGMLAPFCEGESAEEAVVRLGCEAANWWAAKTQAVHRRGSLVVSPARDKSDLAQLRASLVADGAEFIQDDANPDVYAKRGLTIDCRGFQAKHQLKDLRGVKGEMLILSCPDVALSRPIRMLHPRVPIYIVPRGDGIFMLGATMIEGRAGKHITARALLELLSAAYALNPAFGEAEVVEIGVDSRPAFSDNLPRIRREGNLIRVNGLYRHGFLLAPALARMVAELIFDDIKPEMMDEDTA